jgi:hypothetical protein
LKLGGYLDRWLADIRETVRQRTWERYEQIVRVHIQSALGRVKLKALSPTHVRGLIVRSWTRDSAVVPCSTYIRHYIKL